MSLKVTVTEKGPGIFNVFPAGTLDSNTYQILETELEKILRNKPNIVILDLDWLNYISSMGLRVIVKAKKTLKQNDGMLIMVNLQPQIKEVFDIVKALPTEQIFKSVKELDEYLLAMQQKNIADRMKL